jgi:serine/threonine-protein kinase
MRIWRAMAPWSRAFSRRRTPQRRSPTRTSRALDVGRGDDGAPNIALKLLEGTDLAREIERRGPLPVPVAVRVVRQAAEALAEAHARGIVHGDIEPANIFLARTVPPVSSGGGHTSASGSV